MDEKSHQDETSLPGRWLLSGLSTASKLDRVAMSMLRGALVIVRTLDWGDFKFVDYEADSIVPLVANSPVMSFLYHRPSEYRTHMNKEKGERTCNIEPGIRKMAHTRFHTRWAPSS